MVVQDIIVVIIIRILTQVRDPAVRWQGLSLRGGLERI